MRRYIDTPVPWRGEMRIRRHYAAPDDWRADCTRLAQWVCGCAPGLLVLHPNVPDTLIADTNASDVKTTLILLAGGKSRRMGKDKALLPFWGTSLLHFQMEKAQLLGAQLLISAGEDPARLLPLLPPGMETCLIADELPDRGPLGGLAACLKHAQTPRCLVLPVDVPFVPAEVLRSLMDDPKPSPVVQLLHHNRTEALLGRWDAALWQEMERSIHERGVSAHAFAEKAGASTCSSDLEEAFFVNLNQIADYEAAFPH